MSEVNATNNTPRKKQSRGRFLVITIFITVILILLMDVFCIFTSCYPSLISVWSTQSNATEPSGEGVSNSAQANTQNGSNLDDAFLSTGISIIGIAISVWAALNITNALERRDFDALQDKFVQHEKDSKESLKEFTSQQTSALDALKKKHNDEFAELQKAQQGELKKINSEHKKQTEQQQITSKNQLLSELLKTIIDLSTEIIMEQIQAISTKEDVPFAELTHIEQHFARVYSLHEYDKEAKLIKNTADIGIKEAEELLCALDKDMPHKQMIENFLQYRIGDFCFYKAYCCQGKERLDLAERAIEQYVKSLDLFGISIPEYEYQEEYIPNEYALCPKGKKCICAYICNAIGESYSKIAEDFRNLLRDNITIEAIEDYGRKAVFYCAYAVKWCDRGRELYFRNLGCALERVYKDDMFLEKNIKTITSLYQDAFDISISQKHIPEKVFYTWLSFDWKWSDHIIAQIRGEITDYRWLCNKSELVTEQLRNRADIAIHYGQLAKVTYSDIIVHHKFFAFTLRNVCIWEILTNGGTGVAYRHYEEFRQAVVKLNAFYSDPSQWDDFMRELNQYVVEINSYLESHSVLVTTR